MKTGVGFKHDKKSVLLSFDELNYLIDAVTFDCAVRSQSVSYRISKENMLGYLKQIRNDKFL